MAETPQTGEARVDPSAGHLSVHVEGAHPPEIRFAFEQQPKRLGSAFAASFGLNSAIILLVLFVGHFGSSVISNANLFDQPNSEIVWLSQPGPGGGGGGGGNQM